MLLTSSCQNLPAKNDIAFCLWSTPITITEKEKNNCLSEGTKRQIINYDQTWKHLCMKGK
jgi:hypothetical protein